MGLLIYKTTTFFRNKIFIGNHLRTATFVNNSQSEATQLFLNLPFGETMYEQMDRTCDNPFKFNAKELDDDTGLYYYGARYYNPRLSIWYGVDPLGEKYPEWSPYVYTLNNPIAYVDPDGKAPLDIIFRGSDKKEIRIKAPGKNRVVDVPFALNNNKIFDIGMGNDVGRLAFGYTIQAGAGIAAASGGNAGVEMSFVNFSDKTYGGYNYVYAGGHLCASVGDQGGASVVAGDSLFVAYNNSIRAIDPGSFEGKTISRGVSFDVKGGIGAGLNVNQFSGTGNWTDKGWHGVSVGVSIGRRSS